MVDKQSMYMDLDISNSHMIYMKWPLRSIALLLFLLGHCVPDQAQSTDPTANPTLVGLYEDDFSTDKIRYDSYDHSIIWVDGAYPPDRPYLLLCQMGSNDRALIFRNNRDQQAHLVYGFPIAPDAVFRSFPMELEMELEVRFIPENESGNQVTGYLCYYTSADGINWSQATCLDPPDHAHLNLGLLQENRYVKLEGFNVVIDNVRAAIYRVMGVEDLQVPTNQFPHIQDAIDAAIDGETIVVADGVYTGPGDTDLHFRGKRITLMSENGPEHCVIDCDTQFRGVVFDQQETAQAVLDGFTIQDARGSPGSGIYCLNSSPTISNCRLINCVSYGPDQPGQGGGLYCQGGAPLIRDCEFLANHADSDGLGSQGGAIYLAPDAFARIEGCTITQENVAAQGGGIYIAGTSPFVEPQQTVEITNCLIAANEAGAAGGGISLNHNRVDMTNCTIANNSAPVGGGLYIGFVDEVIYQTQMKNCIVWANIPDDIDTTAQARDSDLRVNYSDIGLDWPGQGNISADPCFVGADDYHLVSPAGRWDPVAQTWVHDYSLGISPCIDRGNSDHVVGERTPGDKLANMGCYGMTAQASRGAGSRVFHVDIGGNDSDTGMSRETAFKTIQRAIDVASDGDIVLIWPGTYREEVGFQGKNITVQSAADAATVMAPPDGQGYAFSFFQQEGKHAPCVLRNLIIRNCAQAGIYCTASAPTLTNLTIVDNTLGVLAIKPHDSTISSCIFWGNDGGDVDGFKDKDAVNYSRLQSSSGDLGGQGNLFSNPLFADPENGDFHLQSKYGRFWPEHGLWVVDGLTSPCIDAGEPGIYPRAEPQAHGARINMGAHGGTGYASRSSPYRSCDLNQDGYVDFLDFAIFADNWLMN